MKITIKHLLSRVGIWPLLDLVRRILEIWGWIGAGCTGPAPPPVKRMVLSAYRYRFDLHEFVETGTHMGDTLAYIAYNKAVKCTSIELADEFYQSAKNRFARYGNVTILKGDSGSVLPEILRTLRTPTLFWLDGHYSGAITARGESDTPISAELEAILASPISGHVILIDDVHCFDGTNSYPHLDAVLTAVRANGKYHADVSADIIRLTPEVRS